jgi:hypothetical protein
MICIGICCRNLIKYWHDYGNDVYMHVDESRIGFILRKSSQYFQSKVIRSAMLPTLDSRSPIETIMLYKTSRFLDGQ